MLAENRGDSLSPEKMQGNPPALDLSKIGNCGDIFAAFDPEGSNLDKLASPLSNPKVSVSQGLSKGTAPAMTSNPNIEVPLSVKAESILSSTPRSFRGRFLAKKFSSQKDLCFTPRDTTAVSDKNSEKDTASFLSSKTSASPSGTVIDTADPRLVSDDVQQLQMMLQVMDLQPYFYHF